MVLKVFGPKHGPVALTLGPPIPTTDVASGARDELTQTVRGAIQDCMARAQARLEP